MNRIAVKYGAGVIVEDEAGRYLVVWGDRVGKWSFPKGGMESFDHMMRDTAFRELEEETGVRTNPRIPLPAELPVWEHIVKRPEKECRYRYYLIPGWRLLFPQVLAAREDDEDITEVRWMSLKELLKSPVNKGVSDYLRYKARTPKMII